MENFGMEMIKQFAARSAENGGSLKNITLRTPDITFHDEAKVDLGGGVIVPASCGSAEPTPKATNSPSSSPTRPSSPAT